jgi:hypothetical protein
VPARVPARRAAASHRGAYGCTSNEPMSQIAPPISGRGWPRWSSVTSHVTPSQRSLPPVPPFPAEPPVPEPSCSSSHTACVAQIPSVDGPPRLATDQRAGALVVLKAGQAGRVTPKWWGGETAIVWARVAHPAHECLPEEVGTGWVAIDAATSTFDSGAAQGATEEVLTRLRVALLARPLGLRGKAPCGTWWTDRGAECRLAPYFIYCKVTSWTQHTAKLM